MNSRSDDERHLDMLATAHFWVGGLGVLFGLFPLIHLFIGLAILSGIMPNEGGDPPPDWFGLIFLAAGLFSFLFAQALAWCVIYSGRFLRERRRYTFSFVIACISCLSVPVGTVLGVLTIVVLSRESVKALYQGQGNQPA
ncbi:MAG: hypothetical protein ACFE0O_09130 [Opitutales bacterium]